MTKRQKITPTDEQNKVIKLAKEWWKNKKARRKPFVIQGLAGCVTDDTIIETDHGPVEFSSILKEIDPNYQSLLGVKDYSGEYRVLNCLTFDRHTDITKVFFKGKSHGYHIKTELGKHLKASDDHPLLLDNNTWKTVKHLCIGDYIQTIDGNEKLISKDPIEDYFYDITVPETERFVSNGIISHNCGKSTSVEYIVDELGLDKKNEVKYVAFTGQAAVNLNKKGNTATTIHRLIYDVFEDPRTHIIKFKLKDELEGNPRLILIDEVGMVSQKMLDDLLSFGIPVIAMGDKEQLKSFGDDVNNLLDHPDAELNTPMRQALDSPILRVAYKVLSGQTITHSDASSEGVFIVPKHQIPDHYLTTADQILAGTNRTVDKINNRIRFDIFGLTSPFPYDNEKLMCLQNNWTREIYPYSDQPDFAQSLTNGLTGYGFNFKDYNEKLHTFTLSFTPSYIDEKDVNDENTFHDVIVDALYFRDNIRNDDALFKDDKYKRIMYRRKVDQQTNFTKINKFMPGYAETTYKAQGSEWDNVLYYDEFWGGRDMFKRQRYVAITRAKKNLIIAL